MCVLLSLILDLPNVDLTTLAGNLVLVLSINLVRWLASGEGVV